MKSLFAAVMLAFCAPIFAQAAAPAEVRTLDRFLCHTQEASGEYKYAQGVIFGAHWIFYKGPHSAAGAMKEIGYFDRQDRARDMLFSGLVDAIHPERTGPAAYVFKLDLDRESEARAAIEKTTATLRVVATRESFAYTCRLTYNYTSPPTNGEIPSTPGYSDCETHPELDRYHCDPHYCDNGNCPD